MSTPTRKCCPNAYPHTYLHCIIPSWSLSILRMALVSLCARVRTGLSNARGQFQWYECSHPNICFLVLFSPPQVGIFVLWNDSAQIFVPQKVNSPFSLDDMSYKNPITLKVHCSGSDICQAYVWVFSVPLLFVLSLKKIKDILEILPMFDFFFPFLFSKIDLPEPKTSKISPKEISQRLNSFLFFLARLIYLNQKHDRHREFSQN